MRTVGLQQPLQRVHLVLLALDLQRDGAQGDVAHGPVEDLGQIRQLSALRSRAAHLTRNDGYYFQGVCAGVCVQLPGLI